VRLGLLARSREAADRSPWWPMLRAHGCEPVVLGPRGSAGPGPQAPQPHESLDLVLCLDAAAAEELSERPVADILLVHCGERQDASDRPPGFRSLGRGDPSIRVGIHLVRQAGPGRRVLAEDTAPIYNDDTLPNIAARVDELARALFPKALAAWSSGAPAIEELQPGVPPRSQDPGWAGRAVLAGRLLARRVARALAPRQLAKSALFAFALGCARPVRDLWRTLRRRHPVRIFTYHRVSSLCRDGMTVSPQVFERQLRYLERSHDLTPLPEALRALASGTRLRRPIGVVTFDDAYRSVVTTAWPLLQARRAPAACFATTGLVDTDNRFPHDAANPLRPYFGVMTWAELTDLRDSGWTIGAHSLTHARLSTCALPHLEHELADPPRDLRTHLGVTGDVLAYPFGGIDDLGPEARGILPRYGYTACLSNFGGENFPGVDPLQLRRIDLGGNHPNLAWKAWAHGVDFSLLRRGWTRLRRSVSRAS